MHDSPEDVYRERRHRMVEEQIRLRGITDPKVLAVMSEVPRERFLPPEWVELGYEDRAVCIGADQTISQPYMVGLMTELLEVEPEHRVLEVGTGSGYQTAILARLAKHVYTVERIPELLETARWRLAALGHQNVSWLVGDGSLGWPEEAPFDRVMVTAAAPRLPRALVDQLRDGGRMVIPIGGESHQTLVQVEKLENRIVETLSVSCRFVQLIGAQGWPGDAGTPS